MVVQWVKNPTSIHEDVSLIPVFDLWVKDPVLQHLQHRSQMWLRFGGVVAGALKKKKELKYREVKVMPRHTVHVCLRGLY